MSNDTDTSYVFYFSVKDYMPMVKTVSYENGVLTPKQKLSPIFYKEFEMDRNRNSINSHNIPLKVNQ